MFIEFVGAVRAFFFSLCGSFLAPDPISRHRYSNTPVAGGQKNEHKLFVLKLFGHRDIPAIFPGCPAKMFVFPVVRWIYQSFLAPTPLHRRPPPYLKTLTQKLEFVFFCELLSAKSVFQECCKLSLLYCCWPAKKALSQQTGSARERVFHVFLVSSGYLGSQRPSPNVNKPLRVRAAIWLKHHIA